MAGKKLQGQVAIITGAGRGIGAATAVRFAAAGAAVVLIARSEDEVEAVALQVRKQGGRAVAMPCDITDFETVDLAVESTIEQFGRIDILINNAGVIWPVEELADSDPDEWAYNIFTNLVGPYHVTRSVLPVMLEQGSGRIVTVSSDAAFTPLSGASAYCAAKAGLDMWTRVLALELQGQSVTVNTLLPGHVDTAMQEDIRSIDTTDTRLDTSYFHQVYEEGRLRPPALVADLLYWLAGPWSRGRHGETFHADDPAWMGQVQRDVGVLSSPR